MWPKTIDWKTIAFGVEIESIGGNPEGIELLPGWTLSLDERQIDDTGLESGSELRPPPIRWEDRSQIRVMLGRLKQLGATVNWSCGLHVHVGLEPWGEPVVLPLLEAALAHQESIRTLMNTSPHRMIFCPPVTEVMRRKFLSEPGPNSLRHSGRPQSHRCGINLAAWYDIGTVEYRFANGSLDEDEVLNTIEFCLRYVSAIGAGRNLPNDPERLAVEIGAPVRGYPPSMPAPRWYQERIWLEELLIPILAPYAAEMVPNGEIHHILPTPEGWMVAIEHPDETLERFLFQAPDKGWEPIRQRFV